MSTFNDIDIACEQCGHEFRGTVWTAVHSGEDPELKELLLGGELNMVMCPECSHVAFQHQFMLYQDPVAELVAYVYPERQAREADTLRTMMLKSYYQAQEVYAPKDRKTYDPVLLFGLESLVEMMAQEKARAEQSQIAQELCKENNIPITLLRPSEARRLGIMRVLPSSGNTPKPSRDEILKGLGQLLALNPKLDLYARLKKTIETDKNWTLS